MAKVTHASVIYYVRLEKCQKVVVANNLRISCVLWVGGVFLCNVYDLYKFFVDRLLFSCSSTWMDAVLRERQQKANDIQTVVGKDGHKIQKDRPLGADWFLFSAALINHSVKNIIFNDFITHPPT